MKPLKSNAPEFDVANPVLIKFRNNTMAREGIDILRSTLKSGNTFSSLGCFQLRDKPRYPGHNPRAGNENGHREPPGLKRQADGEAATLRSGCGIPRLLYVVTLG